jgi:c-di-GMP-binding flagellar brake protein YcgR
MSGIERRQSERVTVNWRAAVQPYDSEEVLYGRTIEISATGTGILLDKNLPMLSHCIVYLEMVLPAEMTRKQVALQAQVMNVILAESRFRTGVRFLEVPGVLRDSIQRFVKTHTERWRP